jgi:hypothetical protein
MAEAAAPATATLAALVVVHVSHLGFPVLHDGSKIYLEQSNTRAKIVTGRNFCVRIGRPAVSNPDRRP